MKRILIIASLLLLFSIPIYSQSMFLEKGENGFGVNFGYAINKNNSTIGGNLGYSVGGIFDIGFSVSRTTAKQNGIWSPWLKGITYSPYVDLYIVKQTNEIPLSLWVGASYSKIFYSGGDLDYSNKYMRESGYRFSGGFEKKVPVTNNFSLIPTIGVSWNKYEIEQRNGSTIKEDGSYISLSAGLAFDFNLSKQNKFVIVPGVSVNDTANIAFGINVGFVFPKIGKEEEE